ncbi:tetratricopeptide repeat protein [Legionella bononiensis]|uniref:Tetratricopeptide repeat protein n=1 Tax=Legionella bononiensis TaxID=2793102 RepID=A0ABS1WEJ2_9GAMM|nr:tetratricopeptide repeat protein [Legionella bononiensis]MBL7479318.1 tetratricopeptide repeat protein [Legionella bononiensis]MBL7479362.1 tetratricopeptide repeat protein [Legionella bononiensis]MBL7527778.1 tetratricopeptide repeat protein [Legionella bononiensis]MBL7563541.1 tetratricopeptide repeat protein [Legionella bononiensis]
MDTQTVQDKLNRHLNFLAQDQENLALLIEISDMYIELDDLDSAHHYLEKANLIDREACLGHQGLLHLNQGQLSRAKECFIEALTHMDTPALRYNLGFTHFITHDLDNAWDILSPILEGEHYPEAELLMARILHRQDSLEESISLVEHVLEHNPEDEEALGLLSLLYFDLNEEEPALQACTQALQLNPDNYDAKLVHIMLRLMNQETSVEEIEQLLQISPQDSRLWFALGNTYMVQGDMEAAEHTLKKAIEIYPDFYDCHIALAWCQLLNDRINEAHETYQNAAELVEELADAWGGLALIHALTEDFPQAELLIKKANELNPTCFLTELAESIYFNHINPQKAKEHLLHALKNTEMPISEKLAVLLEYTQNAQQVH